MRNGIDNKFLDTIPGVAENAPVAINIIDMVHSLGIGMTVMSSDQIKKADKGTCITTIHHLGDELWMYGAEGRSL